MAQPEQFCTFFLDGHLFGLRVQQVQEVIRYQEMTRVPLAPQVIRGLINLRGQIVTAIELRRCLVMKDRPAEQLPTNVVIRSEDGSVSLLVDEIGDVLDVDPDSEELPPETLQGKMRTAVRRVYKLSEALLLELDILRVVAEIGNETVTA